MKRMKRAIKASDVTLTTEKMYEILTENNIATDEEIQLVTAINGDNEETYEDILYAREGTTDFSDYINE